MQRVCGEMRAKDERDSTRSGRLQSARQVLIAHTITLPGSGILVARSTLESPLRFVLGDFRDGRGGMLFPGIHECVKIMSPGSRVR